MENLICNMMIEPTNFVTDPSLSKHAQVVSQVSMGGGTSISPSLGTAKMAAVEFVFYFSNSNFIIPISSQLLKQNKWNQTA